MTREQMLVEIDLYRQKGHVVGIHGAGDEWTCQFDSGSAKGATPIEAYEAAKVLRDPDVREDFEPKKLGGSSEE